MRPASSYTCHGQRCTVAKRPWTAGAPVELRILGPTEVRHDGSPVTLRGAKPRQLLVLLAMRPNRPVPAEELIEELWDGEPPPSAATALRVHVGRLRQVLELARNPSAPSGRLPAGSARISVAGRTRRARRAALRATARARPGGRRERRSRARPCPGSPKRSTSGAAPRSPTPVISARRGPRSPGSRSCGSWRSRSWPTYGSRSVSTRW